MSFSPEWRSDRTRGARRYPFSARRRTRAPSRSTPWTRPRPPLRAHGKGRGEIRHREPLHRDKQRDQTMKPRAYPARSGGGGGGRRRRRRGGARRRRSRHSGPCRTSARARCSPPPRPRPPPSLSPRDPAILSPLLIHHHLLAGGVIQVEEDVAELHVAVDHLGAMASRERLGKLRYDEAATDSGMGTLWRRRTQSSRSSPVQRSMTVCIQASSSYTVRTSPFLKVQFLSPLPFRKRFVFIALRSGDFA